jgi:hypothetical protein
VGVHAWGGNFDGSGPVLVGMTQVVCKLLKCLLGQARIIIRHKIVSWCDATLRGVLSNQIEIILDLLSILLDQQLVYHSSWGRVLKLSIPLMRKALVDTLVHHTDCQLGGAQLVVEIADYLRERRDLPIQH